MYLVTNQVNNPSLNILDDCLKMHLSLNKPGPQRNHWRFNKGDVDSVTVPPPYKPQDPFGPVGLDMPDVGLPIFWEFYLNLDSILLGRLLVERWALSESTLGSPWQSWLR